MFDHLIESYFHVLHSKSDKVDLPILDSWTERTADDLWVLGDEVERSILTLHHGMRRPLFIITKEVIEDTMDGLIDRDVYQQRLGGHYEDTINRANKWNWNILRGALENTKLRLTERWGSRRYYGLCY
jgi:hypothetical protein